MTNNNLVNELTSYVLSLDATTMVAQKEEVETLENTVISCKEAMEDRILGCKEAVNSIVDTVKNTANKVLEGIKEAYNPLIGFSMIAILIMLMFTAYAVNEYKLNNEYETAVNNLQKVETSIEFDSDAFWWYGSNNDEILLNELESNHIEPIKETTTHKYYVVVDKSDNQNIVLEFNKTNGDFNWYGKFENELLTDTDKKNNIEVINSIVNQ